MGSSSKFDYKLSCSLVTLASAFRKKNCPITQSRRFVIKKQPWGCDVSAFNSTVFSDLWGTVVMIRFLSMLVSLQREVCH